MCCILHVIKNETNIISESDSDAQDETQAQAQDQDVSGVSAKISGDPWGLFYLLFNAHIYDFEVSVDEQC